MSDAQIDGGDKGAAAEDKVGGFIGDKNDGEAVRWYGMYALAHSVGTIFFYMFFNDKTYVAGNAAWYLSQIEFFLPVFIGWIFVSMFDGEFMRSTFQTLVSLSILGPFGMHWYALANFFLGCEGVCLDSITFWLWLAAYAAYTIFQMIVDIILLPQIFDWTESASIVDNGAENLLAILF